jgi:hypothetical protein
MAQPQASKTYDFAANNFAIGGFTLSGFGEDGGAEYEFPSDDNEHTVGADGQTTVSRTNDPRMLVTFTVMENGRADEILQDLRKKQLAQLEIQPLSYRHSDPLNDDLVTSPEAIFITRPTPSKSRTVGERTYQILLPSAAEQFFASGK